MHSLSDDAVVYAYFVQLLQVSAHPCTRPCLPAGELPRVGSYYMTRRMQTGIVNMVLLSVGFCQC